MNYLRNFLVLQFICFGVYAQTPATDPHWEMIFEDNFNTLDNNVWDVVDYGQHGDYALLMAQNVFVSSGNLVIKMDNNATYCPVNPPTIGGAVAPCVNKTYNYTSGWVETKQEYSTQYGYIEAEIKLPYGKGFFPAFWTFTAQGVSNYDEIDIFEMTPGKIFQGQISAPSGITHNQNWMTTNTHPDYPRGFDTPEFREIPINNYTNWHTYAIEWSPSKIIWYVDGGIVSVVPNTGVGVSGIHELNRIILNFDLFNNPLAFFPNLASFPALMLVNYVKMYQLKTDCNNSINVCNYNFAQHDNKVKNNIHIGNGGCTNVVPVGSNIVLRASDGVLLSGNFSVPYGASLYADAGAGCSNLCARVFHPCLYNFTNYDNQIKQSIQLGGNGAGNCDVTVTSPNDLSLKAINSIVLKPGVTIVPQPNKQITLKLENCN